MVSGPIECRERDRRSLDSRDREVRALGFASFDDYLASDLFASVMARVLGRSGRCGACPAPATSVRFYSFRRRDLDGSDLSRLFGVCGPCEAKSRVRESDDSPLTTAQADSKLRQMATVYRRRVAGR